MECNENRFKNSCIFSCGTFAILTLCWYSVGKYYQKEGTLLDNTFTRSLFLDVTDTKNSPQSFSSYSTVIGIKSPKGSEKRIVNTLSDYLFNFPWQKFEESVKTENENAYRQQLIDGIQKYAYQEPLTPINDTCTPPLLLNPKDIVCSDFPDAFLPKKYETPVKVAHAIQLGFDADTLEIHLNELYDVIDYFFILEATRVHCKVLR